MSASSSRRDVFADAVLAPLDDHMGLDIARRLSAAGVRVWGIDAEERIPGRHSSACSYVHCPYSEESQEHEFIDYLVSFGRSLRGKAVLYPLSDRHVLLASEYRDVLAPFYSYVMPPHETMLALTTKDGLDTIAREHEIPAPTTFFLGADSDIRAVATQVPYPAILKPSESTYWHSAEITRLLRSGVFAGRAKVVVCNSAEELIDAFERIAVYDPRMIVQEVIPGEDSCLVYAAFYVDRDGVLLGYFSGRKHRVIPTGFGSASFVETFSDPRLKELVTRILMVTGYRGLGGLEFKEDPRDGSYKLIEFNTRFGMWDALGIRCGVDLPTISYRDGLGLPVEPQTEFVTGIKWVDWQRDLRAFLDYRRKGLMTTGGWLRSLSGPKMIAIYSWRDWRPGVAFTFELVRKLFGRALQASGLRRATVAERP